MGNPKVSATCTRCGFERLHYTRKSGSLVRPCMVCSREAARKLAASKATDPEWAAKRREQWSRYNSSAKGKARLKRARQVDGEKESQQNGIADGGNTTPPSSQSMGADDPQSS